MVGSSIYQDRTVSLWHSRTYGNNLTLTVDNSVTAMAMSPWGRDVALAGRRGLYIIDLDNPFSPPRWLRHLTSWEVADVQWSPHNHRPYWVISSSNQKGIIWNLSRPSSNAHEYILHGHERAITDINYHNAHPDILGTCSVDAHCFVWDVRSSARKPVYVCCDWETGTSQIKWNHKNEYIFASAHGERLNIWDTRFGNTPLFRIRAHDGKINGLNFNKNKETEIISCSNDHTVKSWDYTSGSLDLKFTINTNFPVLKARYLPVGKAMGILPLRGGNNSLKIIDIPEENTVVDLNPVHEFTGHRKPVSEFLWCRRYPKVEGTNNEFQLVTWAKDKDLRVWRTDTQFYEKVKYNYKGPLEEKDIKLSSYLKSFKYCTYRNEPNTIYDINQGKITNILTSDVNWITSDIEVGNHLQWISNVQTDDLPDGSVNRQDPFNLGKELRLSHGRLAEEFPDIMFEDINVTGGKLVFSLYSPVLSDLDDLISCSDEDKPLLKKLSHEKQETKASGDIARSSSTTNEKNDNEISGSSNKKAGNENEKRNEEDEDENNPVFLRIKLTFPEDYPFKRAPAFYIESNHDTTRKERESIKQLLEYIASKCVSADKFCLELIFQFLVGRIVDLDFLLQQDTSLSDNSDDLIDAKKKQGASENENHSAVQNVDEDDENDEEDDEDDDEDVFFNNGFDFDIKSPSAIDNYDENEEAIPPTHKAAVPDNFNTPGEIHCGARWAPNGQLVYFTMPKSKRKTESVAFKSDYYFNEKPVQRYELKIGKHIFESSQVQSLFQRNIYDDSYSDDSDDSDGSIVDDYFESLTASKDGRASYPLDIMNFLLPKNQRRGLKRIKNVVAMLNFDSILPSKVELAQTYKISGKSAYEIANNNAKSASNLLIKSPILSEDLLETCNVWSIIKVIVLNKELREDVDQAGIFDLVINNGSGYDHNSMKTFQRLLSEQDWGLGLHFFGNKWLVKNIVDYYEARYDVQMLAMLSCVLFENGELTSNDKLANNGQAKGYDNIFSSELPFTNESNFFNDESNFFNDDSNFFNDRYSGANGYKGVNQDAPFVTNYAVINAPDFKVSIEVDQHLNFKDSYSYANLFDESLMERLKKYRDIYGDMLLSWGLPLKRAEVLKFNYKDSADESKYNFISNNQYKMLEVRFQQYNEKILVCDFCSIPVKRQQIQICNHCHHILHGKCAKKWFKSTHKSTEHQYEGTEEECPSGCGCKCLRHL